MFVYDVSEPLTFANLPIWLAECHAQIPFKTPPRFLVANKTDKIQDDDGAAANAGIPPADGPGRRFAERHNLDGFHAVSARESKNPEAFQTILEDVARAVLAAKKSERSSPASTPRSLTPFDDSPAVYGRRRESQRRQRLNNKIRFETSNSLHSSSSVVTTTEEEVRVERRRKCC